MADFKDTVNSLFKGMDAFLSSKTVIGEPITIGDTVLLPLVDVSFGVAAGAAEGTEKKSGVGGGMGGKMSPSAVLVLKGDTTRMVSIKNQDSISKLIDMVPEFVDKFSKGVTSYMSEKDKKDACEKMEEELSKSVENAVTEE